MIKKLFCITICAITVSSVLDAAQIHSKRNQSYEAIRDRLDKLDTADPVQEQKLAQELCELAVGPESVRIQKGLVCFTNKHACNWLPQAQRNRDEQGVQRLQKRLRFLDNVQRYLQSGHYPADRVNLLGQSEVDYTKLRVCKSDDIRAFDKQEESATTFKIKKILATGTGIGTKANNIVNVVIYTPNADVNNPWRDVVSNRCRKRGVLTTCAREAELSAEQEEKNKNFLFAQGYRDQQIILDKALSILDGDSYKNFFKDKEFSGQSSSSAAASGSTQPHSNNSQRYNQVALGYPVQGQNNLQKGQAWQQPVLESEQSYYPKNGGKIPNQANPQVQPLPQPVKEVEQSYCSENGGKVSSVDVSFNDIVKNICDSSIDEE